MSRSGTEYVVRRVSAHEVNSVVSWAHIAGRELDIVEGFQCYLL